MKAINMSINRRFLTDKDKIIIGTKCANCNTKEDLEYHHIVPLSLGGFDINSNIVCLCGLCHKIVHNGKMTEGSYNHSKLIKMGLKKATNKGIHIGRRKTTLEDIPASFKNIYPYIKDKSVSISEAGRKLNLSRPTIYKYMEIIDNVKKEKTI